MSQPAPVHCWCRILREAGGGDAKCGPCLVRALAAAQARIVVLEGSIDSDLIARLRDYHDQVLQGFRHISRVEEADLIQVAIDGLRQQGARCPSCGAAPGTPCFVSHPVPPAEGEK